MHLRTALLCALLLAPTGARAAADETADCANAANQMDMNACVSDAQAKTDAELNRVYGTLKGKLDPVGQRNLVTAERAWIQFRDAECNLRSGYDTADPQANGTLAPALVGTCRADLSRQRIQDLQAQIRCPGGDLACKP